MIRKIFLVIFPAKQIRKTIAVIIERFVVLKE